MNLHFGKGTWNLYRADNRKMQPLYSVDHETRQNSYRREDDTQSPNEDTPLLVRFPLNQTDGSPRTTVIVSLLLSILVLGVVIGIYLLILQSNAENVLPPVETPLQLVTRIQWDHSAVSHPILSLSPVQATQVIIVQTDSDQCTSTASCSSLLKNLQANLTSHLLLPYNFLVSSNGQTYESLGWHTPSPLFPEYSGTMVLAFIGNFTEFPPTKFQMDEARNFFAESVSQQHLSPSFDIIGKKSTYCPTRLFEAFRSVPQWNDQLSDA